MKRAVLAATVCAGSLLWLAAGTGSALAQTPAVANDDAAALLASAYRAARALSFTGTFVYREGAHAETSRIARLVDANGVHERIEVIDGPEREFVRTNDEMRCYNPQTQTVRIERGVSDRPILGTLPADPASLLNHYRVIAGPVERVADLQCRLLTLEPRDAMRYGHRLCAEVGSRMILKGITFDARSRPVESFVFTQIAIGATVPREQLQSRYEARARGWKLEEAAVPANAESGWTLQRLPEGYQKLAEFRRRLRASPEVNQIVVSDGRAAVSVFIEPARGGETPVGASRRGATSVFVRRLENHLITVVGDAPAECVETIAHSVAPRGRP